MSSAQTSENTSSGKTVTFSTSAKSAKSNKRIKPLTREFFTQLLKLETEFHNKVYTVTTLDELIQFYAKAVEYYDSIKDEISSYFMFKIQDILATKKSLKMLFDQNTRSGGRRGHENPGEQSPSPSKPNNAERIEHQNQEVKTSAFEQKDEIGEVSSEDEDEEDKITEMERKRKAHKKKGRADKLSISVMKNEKQRFVNFFYKMETQKAISRQNMNALMDQFDKSSDKNDDFVKTDIDSQRDRLRQRLDKRKVENFNSHTLSIQPRFSRVRDEVQEVKRDEMIYESFLENLNQAGVDENGMEHIREESGHFDTESVEEYDEHPQNGEMDNMDITPSRMERLPFGITSRHRGQNSEDDDVKEEAQGHEEGHKQGQEHLQEKKDEEEEPEIM